ncbi:MAG: hypothetical protein HSCHL_0983 [Hydrogenibacillus schlegelii]|uniref:Uncharacterized protein n=1 Tax=Hydrogenibacillus schlegelii TaxID=1484 RepID=A0A2T5G6U4_HYDSH|nr:hypothetical protein [Hydrogenibacillus schlegelii]PTQ51907.1 MAG: hypothetical protein HSCHL_0983 [Hydrogenibacillus schlegelii]
MEESAGLIERINAADPKQLEGTFGKFVAWFYGFVQENSTLVLLLGLVLAVLMLIGGIIFTARWVGRAIALAAAVLIAYVVIQYAPDIVGSIAKAVNPKAVQELQNPPPAKEEAK